MRIPRFWARAEREGLASWGSSDRDESEARSDAEQRLARLVARFRDPRRPIERYAYGDRALREPILEETFARGGQRLAAITRNAYGCRVLNTTSMMMLDIDFDDAPRAPRSRGWWRKLAGAAPARDPAEEHVDRLKAWLEAHGEWSVRLYRTHSGLRGLVTHAAFDPEAEPTLALLRELRCDPLYVQLCKAQACFRARLDPKPWRIGVLAPIVRFPFQSPEPEAEMRRWVGEYERVASKFRVCRFLGTFGRKDVLPELEPLVGLHDERTGALAAGDLA